MKKHFYRTMLIVSVLIGQGCHKPNNPSPPNPTPGNSCYLIKENISGIPLQSDLTVTLLNYPSSGSTLTTPHFQTNTFTYDNQQRLIKIVAGGATVTNLTTYDISYDANGDVSKIVINKATGPRYPVAIITASDYDDKPTPYAAEGKQWKFLQHTMYWGDTGEPILIAALSAHNPGKVVAQSLDATRNDGNTKPYQSSVYNYNCK